LSYKEKMNLTQDELLALTGAPGAQYILINENETVQECYAGYADILKAVSVINGCSIKLIFDFCDRIINLSSVAKEEVVYYPFLWVVAAHPWGVPVAVPF